MHYYVLSLPEAAGLYLGLALQHTLRAGPLRWAPLVLVLYGIMSLLRQAQEDPHIFSRLGWYLCCSSLLCVLFWPEASTFGRGGQQVGSDQIASYSASQDPNATIVTARDAGEADRVVLEPWGFGLLLRAMTEVPLALARVLHQETHRGFSTLIGTSWLLGMELTADSTRALTDWIEGCWKPSLAQDQAFQDAITAQELLPWGNTPVARALASREAIPGAMTGKGYLRSTRTLGTYFLSNPGSGNAVRCDVYLAAVEQDVQDWLFTTTSPAGVRLAQLFQDDVGWSVQQQARFLLHREMLRALGRPAPAPSLAGAYAVAQGANTALHALGGAAGGSGRGLLGGLFGGAQSGLTQAGKLVEQFTTWLGYAVWFIFWAPQIFGIALLVLIGLAPFVYCWMFVPGAPFKPIVTYFLMLLYVCCAPLWFALVMLAARAAATFAPQTSDPILQALEINLATSQLYEVITTVLGLALVQPLGASILFLAVRFFASLRHS